MDALIFAVSVVALYVALGWFADKIVLWAARDPNKLVEGNGRVKDLAFFAAIGIVMTTIQLLLWAVQGIAWLLA